MDHSEWVPLLDRKNHKFPLCDAAEKFVGAGGLNDGVYCIASHVGVPFHKELVINQSDVACSRVNEMKLFRSYHPIFVLVRTVIRIKDDVIHPFWQF